MLRTLSRLLANRLIKLQVSINLIQSYGPPVQRRKSRSLARSLPSTSQSSGIASP